MARVHKNQAGAHSHSLEIFVNIDYVLDTELKDGAIDKPMAVM